MAGAPRVTTPIVTLKKRPEFLAARKGARWATPHFVVEALKRDSSSQQPDLRGPRFGFTVSKQVGGAVERNRIKRRLRAAVAQLQAAHAVPMFDYVLIARRPALDAPFAALLSDLATALERVSRERETRGARPASRHKQSPKRQPS
jgi:ribonuclease P protein component